MQLLERNAGLAAEGVKVLMAVVLLTPVVERRRLLNLVAPHPRKIIVAAIKINKAVT